MAHQFKDLPTVSENIITEDISKRVSNENLRQDDTTEIPAEKQYSVGLIDIDTALGYFFNEVIKPYIVENNQTISVPVIYGYPERWSSMKKQGYYRDGKSKLILPLIMYRKTGFTRNDNMYFPRLDQLYYISAKKWDSKNKYDKFNILSTKTGRKFNEWQNNTDRYALTSLPNYIIINYEGVIWTSFTEQLNKLIEKIMFKDNTYWGDPKKFKFRTEVESFDTPVEISVDTERIIKANFNMVLYGYILPEDVDGKMTTRISLSPKKIFFGVEGDTIKI